MVIVCVRIEDRPIKASELEPFSADWRCETASESVTTNDEGLAEARVYAKPFFVVVSVADAARDAELVIHAVGRITIERVAFCVGELIELHPIEERVTVTRGAEEGPLVFFKVECAGGPIELVSFVREETQFMNGRL